MIEKLNAGGCAPTQVKQQEGFFDRFIGEF